MKITIPKMPDWEQVGGDMNPGTYGGIIARSDGDAIEMLHIQPVREYIGDGEAAEVGFPYWSREGYYDLDDLQLNNDNVHDALQHWGWDESNLEELTPTQRALAIAEALLSYGLSDEGPAGWAADVVPDKVKWWGGETAGPEYFEDEEDEFRSDILGEEDEDDEDDEDELGALPYFRAKTIARWETRGGRYWIELYQQEDGSFTYREDNGGGNLGNMSLADAMAEMERRVSNAKKYDNINMRRVPDGHF